MELYTTYHAKFVKTTEWAQKNTASKLTVLNILILNYYFLFFCKNVGIVIPLSLTCGVTGDGCLSPGSGASFDAEDVLAAKPARKSKSKPDTRRRKDESRGKHDKLKERRSKSGKVRRNGEKY